MPVPALIKVAEQLKLCFANALRQVPEQAEQVCVRLPLNEHEKPPGYGELLNFGQPLSWHQEVGLGIGTVGNLWPTLRPTCIREWKILRLTSSGTQVAAQLIYTADSSEHLAQ